MLETKRLPILAFGAKRNCSYLFGKFENFRYSIRRRVFRLGNIPWASPSLNMVILYCGLLIS